MMVGRRPRSGLDKLVRLGVMAELLLAEVRRAPLDEAALLRLREAQEAGWRELGDCLSPRLEEELGRLAPPVVGDPPSAGELRVAQAELVGWLEGLTAAVQSVMVAKAARRGRGAKAHGSGDFGLHMDGGEVVAEPGGGQGGHPVQGPRAPRTGGWPQQ